MSADKPNAAPGPPEQLRSLGKYQISGRLGAGGMGAVFLATDIELRRPVALKVLPKDRAENPTLVKRFRAEAQAVAQLRHNNIVAIYEAGEIQGYPYLALELVEGQDLQSIIEKRGPMPPKRSLKIIRQVTEALAHAAERNIVHRDIKPSNLLVQVDGTCKITDFGLARTVDDTLDTSITRAGTTVGTVDYISPEQAVDSKAADIRSDIYSLGCTWYHMLTGQPPYPDGSMQNKLHGHISSPIPNPRSLNPNVPEAYVAVLHQMMAKRPQDRYQTPADLLDDLDRVAGAVNQINAELFDEPVSGAESDATLASEDAPPGTGQESSPARRQSRSPDDPPAKRGKASSRTEPAPEESEAAPSRINPKLKGRGSETGRRAARGRSDAVDGAAAEAASPEEGTRPRQLPPRKQSGAGAFAIDVDLGRIALIGLVVACAVGLFWWALSRGTSWSTSTISAIGEGEPPAPNVDAVVVNPHEPQEQNPDAPRAPQGAPAAVAKVELPHRTPGASLVLRAADPQDVTRQGESFPGLDDAGGHETPLAREFLPDWVYAVRNAPTEGLTKVVVESPPRAGSVGTIEAAIHQSPARERVIELKGNGPFPLRPTVVQGCQRLILRAAEGSEPIILLQGNPDDTKGEGYLHLSGGVLELNGLHVLAQTVVTGQPRTLLSVTGGTIVLRNCSVTIPEEAGPTIAVRVTASAGFDFPSRVLLERCLIRGRLATAVDCRGPRADVVIGGSLLANESSPLVSAEVVAAAAPPASEPPAAPAGNPAPPAGHASEAAAGPSASAGSTALFVRVLGSVLWTNGEALRLSQPASLSIQRGVVQLRRSILASAGGDTATLLGLPAWPGRSTSLSGQPRVAGLMWRQERSWLAGWPTLVRLGETSAASEGEWQSFWAAPLETASLTSAPGAPLASAIASR